MGRRATLAVDLMSTEALWNRLYDDAIALAVGLEGGSTREDRALRTRRVLQIVRELRLRGVQLSMHWE